MVRVVAVLLFQICPMGARRELMPKVMVSRRVLWGIIVREIRVKKDLVQMEKLPRLSVNHNVFLAKVDRGLTLDIPLVLMNAVASPNH